LNIPSLSRIPPGIPQATTSHPAGLKEFGGVDERAWFIRGGELVLGNAQPVDNLGPMERSR